MRPGLADQLNDRGLARGVHAMRAEPVVGQLGHDRLAYENPAYRQLVGQAIRYVAQDE